MEYLAIGKIKKPHGLTGELKATIDERFFADVSEVEAFFVEIQGEQAPYFIESIRGKGPFILKFEDIDSKEDAALLTNKNIFLRREDVSLSESEIEADGLAYSYLKGWAKSGKLYWSKNTHSKKWLLWPIRKKKSWCR